MAWLPRRLAWAVAAFLAVSLPLVVLLHPVVDVQGPGWVGHVHLALDVLIFVPLWDVDGRSRHLGALSLELAAGVAAGIWVLVCSVGRKRPEGKGGAV